MPGWGYQLPPDRVLAEMREVGLAATELGPDGFLPAEPEADGRDVLDQHHLHAVGGFTPLLLHVPGHDPVPEVDRLLDGLRRRRAPACWCCRPSPAWTATTPGRSWTTTAGATCWATWTGWPRWPPSAGCAPCCTRTSAPWSRTATRSSGCSTAPSIALCLDTGHLLIGGTDPAELTRQAPERIAHTHLKDVDARLARRGPGRPADLHRGGARRACTARSGTGDVDVAGDRRVTCSGRGYDGWYVLEQDTILTEEPAGEGPVADVRTSVEYLRGAAGPAPGSRARDLEPLRIGVLGAARITELAIVGPARTTGDRLVAVAARDRSRAEAFAAAHGVERVAGTYADVVADPEVEVVYNPLANSLHGPWNLAAVAAGKHVLTEKPSASNAAEAAEVRDAAAAAGVTVLEGFHYLHHPVTRRLLELLGSGELGELRRVEIDVVIPAPADSDPRWSLELAGGALMDLGCYALHAHRVLAPWAGGAPRLVAARGRRARRPPRRRRMAGRPTSSSPTAPPAPPAATWPATATAGPSGSSAPRRGDRGQLRPARTSTTASLVVDRNGRPGRGAGPPVLATPTSSRPSGAHLRDGTPLPVGPDDAVETMTLIDACYQSAGFTPRPVAPTATGTPRSAER